MVQELYKDHETDKQRKARELREAKTAAREKVKAEKHAAAEAAATEAEELGDEKRKAAAVKTMTANRPAGGAVGGGGGKKAQTFFKVVVRDNGSGECLAQCPSDLRHQRALSLHRAPG
eukprot:SAG22_NODE_301_length_12744_cov_19.648189_2_plen_118_part_00